MDGTMVISSPWSETWVAWTMLGLLILAAAAYALQPQALGVAFRTLFTGKDRSSVFIDTAIDKRVLALNALFAIGTLAMAVYVVFYASLSLPSFLLSNYAWILLLTTGIVLIRTIVQAFTAFIFFPGNQLETFTSHYYYLTVCTTTVLYPITLLSLFWDALSPNTILWLHLAVIVAYLLILLLKCILILVRSFKGFLFALAYILFYEVTALAAIGATAYFILTNNIAL